ncbi:UNVERIFIED_CONTAM: putative mitochondrial protein, partial [Sesamum indicum]
GVYGVACGRCPFASCAPNAFPVRNGKPSGACFDCDLLKHGQHKPRPSKGWSVASAYACRASPRISGPMWVPSGFDGRGCLSPLVACDAEISSLWWRSVGNPRFWVRLLVARCLRTWRRQGRPATACTPPVGSRWHPHGRVLEGGLGAGGGQGQGGPPAAPKPRPSSWLGRGLCWPCLAARVRRGDSGGALERGSTVLRAADAHLHRVRRMPSRPQRQAVGGVLRLRFAKTWPTQAPSKQRLGRSVRLCLSASPRISGPMWVPSGFDGRGCLSPLLVVGEVSAIPILGALASSPLPANMEASRAAGDGLHPRPSAPGGTHTGRVWSSSSSVARDPEISSTWLAKCRQSRHARLPHGSWGMLLGALASSPSPAKVEASHRQVGPVPRFVLLGSQLVLRPESSCLPGHAWACLLPFACRDARMRRGTAGVGLSARALRTDNIPRKPLQSSAQARSCLGRGRFPVLHTHREGIPLSRTSRFRPALHPSGPRRGVDLKAPAVSHVPRTAARARVVGPLRRRPISRMRNTRWVRGPRPLFAPKASVRRFVRTTPATVLGSSHAGGGVGEECYLVDPASSHMLVSKIKPCMCNYSLFDGTCYSDNRSNSRANTCNKPRLLEGMHLLDKRSTRAPPVAAMIHDNSTDRTALVPATHHSNFCPINFRWVRFRRGSLRNGYHIQGRQQARKLPNPDTGRSAASFFEQLLSAEPAFPDEMDRDCLEDGLTDEDRCFLCTMPTMAEVREAVFCIEPESVAGPDGFGAIFYHTCWDLVSEDVFCAVSEFFRGIAMPKSFTATTISLIPKTASPVSWSEYRPISLCNVTNKICTKLMSIRLGHVLPKVLSPSQSGFVPGRLLSDNVLLAQELVHSLESRRSEANVIFKLDMAKAYDRVNWEFLFQVLRLKGFPQHWINLVANAVSNCWFSVLVNGEHAGFFHSTRGLRQGDPLSPALFVLAADYLSQGLNRLFVAHPMMYYQSPGRVRVSHLAYADDMMIFTNICRQHMELLRDFLHAYERVSGQRINSAKSSFILSRQAMPLHLLQVIHPPKSVLITIERIFNGFFWGSYNGRRHIHWCSWDKICRPVAEGGLGIRSLAEYVRAFSMKLWWRFRLKSSLWSEYLHDRYCRALHPTHVPYNRNHSSVWHRLCRIRDVAEPLIFWTLGQGAVSFWHDNWFGEKPLAQLVRGAPDTMEPVCYYWHEGEWNVPKIFRIVPPQIAHIICRIPIAAGQRDRIVWTATSNGTFSTASAWEAIRVASPRRQLFTDIWHRSLRPTVSVFLWRLFQDWIPVDERMKRKGFSFASKCQCCEAEESISHLFVEGEVVREVWLHFANVFGLQLCETGDLVNLVHFWRYSTPFHSDLHIRTLVPFLILWSTWTQRNAAKYHGAHFTATGTILEVQRHLRTLYAARIMTSIQWKGDLHRALAMGFCFRPIAPQAPRVVRWSTPSPAWFKLNSDGSSLGNPGPAAAAGIIRDADGQVRLAYQFALGTATSVVSELTAVWRGLELARAHSLAPIVVEVDATVVLQLLQSRASGIWEVQHLIMRIVQLQQELGSDVRHIFREANGAADHLAKDAASRQLTRVMYQEDITGVLRGIIRLDKMGTPYLRRWTLGWAGRSASGVHRSSRPFCRRCAPGLNWPGRASGAVTLKKLECSKQAYALYTLAWDNIIGFRSYYVGLRDRTFAKDVFINQERKLGARRRSDTVLVSTINDADQGSADVAFRTPPAPYEKSKSLGSGGSMVARLKLKGIDGRAPPGVEPAA